MRIAHVSLASNFTDGLTYQENLLAAQNARDGHEVCIIADCSQFSSDSHVVQTPAGEWALNNGVRLIRLPLLPLFPSFLTFKLRISLELYRTLVRFKPDVILYHGVVGAGLVIVGHYKRRNPHVRLFLDSHEDKHNSGRNWVSKWIQYRFLTRLFLSRVIKDVEKVLCVSHEAMEFLSENLKVPRQLLEFYPLGGELIEQDLKNAYRQRIRVNLGFSPDDVVFVHSGKLDRGKRTRELLEAFSRVPSAQFRLVILGNVPPEDRVEMYKTFAADSRVMYLGWKTGSELVEHLCAADCYVQPGTQSATLQVALCCGLPIAVRPYPSHSAYLVQNGFFVETVDDLIRMFSGIKKDPRMLSEMSKNSYQLARKILDYRVLASRLTEPLGSVDAR
jgi:glycosyltransferase involved in cell wall biosynthesis